MTAQKRTRDVPARNRLLIIEDEPLVAEALREDLIDAGFEVVGVANRLEKALKFIPELAFDAAIVDANLAGKSAAPAIEALMALGRPFVVLSGYTRDQLSEPFSSAKFIRKPYSLDELVGCVSTLVPDQ